MSRVAIYARVHETGLPVAWSAGRCRKHVGNHRARCVIDPRCRGYRVIAYRPSWYPRESRAHIFSSFVEHRRRDNHRRKSGKFCSWMQVGIYYRVYFGLFTPPRLRTYFVLPFSLICIPLSVSFRNSCYFKWIPAVACCAPSSTTSHASFYWNIIFPFTDGLSEIAGKFFTSGRHESYNSTFQRGPPFGRVGMSRYENEEQCAIARGKGIFSAASRFCEFYSHREMMDANAWKFRINNLRSQRKTLDLITLKFF